MSLKNGGEEMVKSECPSPYRKQGEGNKNEKRKTTNGSKDEGPGANMPAKKQKLEKNPNAKGDSLAHFGTELIARVASFASIANSEVMNICLAVGPLDSNAIRQAYMRENEKYLEDALRSFLMSTKRKKPAAIKCRDDYRAWMAVNSDWKRLCTKERMQSFQKEILGEIAVSGAGSLGVNGIYARSTEICDGLPVYRMQGIWRGRPCSYCLFRCRLSNGDKKWFIAYVPQGVKPGTTKDVDYYVADLADHFDFPPKHGWRSVHHSCAEGVYPPPIVQCFNLHATFNSPALAIELGLLEILKFHVDEMNVDINSAYASAKSYERRHLLAVAMDEDNVEAFRFLYSQKGIDVQRAAVVGDDYVSLDESLLQYALSLRQRKQSPNADFFLKSIIEHSTFNVNDAIVLERYDDPVTPLQAWVFELQECIDDQEDHYFFTLLLILLGKGADPNLETEDRISPAESATEGLRISQRRYGERSLYTIVWHRVVALLQNPTEGLQRWNDLNRDTEAFFFF